MSTIQAIVLSTFVHGPATYQPGDSAEFSPLTFVELAEYNLVRTATAADTAPAQPKKAPKPANKKAPEPLNKAAPEPENKALPPAAVAAQAQPQEDPAPAAPAQHTQQPAHGPAAADL